MLIEFDKLDYSIMYSGDSEQVLINLAYIGKYFFFLMR